MPVADEPSPAAPPSMLQNLQSVWRELPGLVSDRVDLLALELQRAGLALMQILALVVAAAILAVTAWLALWGCVVGLLMALQLHWSLALLLVLMVNVGAAWWAVARVRKLVPALRLPATRRHLLPGTSPQPREPKPESESELKRRPDPVQSAEQGHPLPNHASPVAGHAATS